MNFILTFPFKITAMKKRGRESILLDAEKVNHKNNGMESSEKDNVKKSKVSIVRKTLVVSVDSIFKNLSFCLVFTFNMEFYFS